MYQVNEELSVCRDEDGSIHLNVETGSNSSVVVHINKSDWADVCKQVGVSIEGESMFDEARKAHEKFVQLEITAQLQVGVNIALITEEEAKNMDSIKLHNAILGMIYGDKANLSKTDAFMTEVERFWKERMGRQG